MAVSPRKINISPGKPQEQNNARETLNMVSKCLSGFGDFFTA
jgi:hypothetical protein